MNKVFNLLIIITIAFLPIGFSGCSGNKAAVNNNIRDISAKRLINEIEQNEFAFEQFQAKFNAKVDAPDGNISLKGQIRMENDSLVWVSVSLPVGIEVVRILITKDSVFLVNRGEKTYLKQSIANFKQIPEPLADIGMIQSVLVGNDKSLRFCDKHKVEILNDCYNLLITNILKNVPNDNENTVLSRCLVVQPETFRIKRCEIQQNFDKNMKIELNYDDFLMSENQLIPTRIELDIKGDPNLNIIITYSNITLNVKQDYNFNIPKKFKPAQ